MHSDDWRQSQTQVGLFRSTDTSRVSLAKISLCHTHYLPHLSLNVSNSNYDNDYSIYCNNNNNNKSLSIYFVRQNQS